jgi:predicted membrane GTPase involved in stress response
VKGHEFHGVCTTFLSQKLTCALTLVNKTFSMFLTASLPHSEEVLTERAMDSLDLEQERGITILAKVIPFF